MEYDRETRTYYCDCADEDIDTAIFILSNLSFLDYRAKKVLIAILRGKWSLCNEDTTQKNVNS